MRLQDVIRHPLLTEKSTDLRDHENIMAFEVAVGANKIEIKKAVEAQFKIKVAEVRTAHVRGKLRRQGQYEGRRPQWKKAYVRLAAGEKAVDFFEGT